MLFDVFVLLQLSLMHWLRWGSWHRSSIIMYPQFLALVCIVHSIAVVYYPVVEEPGHHIIRVCLCGKCCGWTCNSCWHLVSTFAIYVGIDKSTVHLLSSHVSMMPQNNVSLQSMASSKYYWSVSRRYCACCKQVHFNPKLSTIRTKVMGYQACWEVKWHG